MKKVLNFAVALSLLAGISAFADGDSDSETSMPQQDTTQTAQTMENVRQAAQTISEGCQQGAEQCRNAVSEAYTTLKTRAGEEIAKSGEAPKLVSHTMQVLAFLQREWGNMKSSIAWGATPSEDQTAQTQPTQTEPAQDADAQSAE